jgi:hypothetical protein
LALADRRVRMACVTRSLSTLGLLFFCSCAITQNVSPVNTDRFDGICVVRNPQVREGFLEAYRTALEGRGLRVRVLDRGEGVEACTVASTYRANWSWDLALYMSYAEIKVFRDRQLVGKAEYDSTAGGFNLGKFISGGKKVDELVGQLFPAAR